MIRRHPKMAMLPSPKCIALVLATALALGIAGAGIAGAQPVELIADEMPAESLATKLFPETSRTRSIVLTQPEKPTIAFAVQFAFDSAEIQTASKSQLDELGKMLELEKVEGKRLLIEGHTDSSGGNAYNQMLSERRARAVADYLASKHGVDRKRLDTMGRGETRPLEGSKPSDPTNRRVQFQAAD